MKASNLKSPNHGHGDKDNESLSAETVHILVYHIDEQGYGLFLSNVERTVRAVAITPLKDAPETIMGIINFQGRVIPVVNMRKKLQVPEREVDIDDHFVIARTARRTVALPVDSVRGVVEQTKAGMIPSEEILPELDNLKGVIKLPDGLILIHDLDRFVFEQQEESLDDALPDN